MATLPSALFIAVDLPKLADSQLDPMVLSFAVKTPSLQRVDYLLSANNCHSGWDSHTPASALAQAAAGK